MGSYSTRLKNIIVLFCMICLSVLSVLSGCAGTRPSERFLPPVALTGIWHVVQDRPITVQELAKLYGVPAQDIEEINGITFAEPITLNHQVFIPGAVSLKKNSVASQGSPAKRNEVGPIGKIASPNDLIWPVYKGKLISRFGLRGGRPHEGIDIGAAEGNAILATADGWVIYAGSKVRGYGNFVILRHAGGLVSVYAHNRVNLVKEKDRVLRGQVIAEVGKTGNATTSHLHFEIRKGEVPVDPEPLVRLSLGK